MKNKMHSSFILNMQLNKNSISKITKNLGKITDCNFLFKNKRKGKTQKIKNYYLFSLKIIIYKI